MSNKKYFKYSPEKLEFEEVYRNTLHKYIRNYPLFLYGVITTILIFFILLFFVRTPNERRLLKEKRALMTEFERLNKKVENSESLINILSSKDDSLYRVILGMDPLPTSIKEAGKGGSYSKNQLGIDTDNKRIKTISDKTDRIQSKAVVLDYSYEKLLKEVKKHKEKMKHIPAIMPIYNKDLKRTGAGFGMRFHPILKIKRIHEGIDFYANTGTEVYATADGKIKDARYSTTFGNIIIVDHGYGLETFYAHLSKFNIKKDQPVKRGQVIGYVGSTGLSSGPHLHYEVHLNSKEIDPVHYFYGDLTPKQYKKIIELSEREVYSMD